MVLIQHKPVMNCATSCWPVLPPTRGACTSKAIRISDKNSVIIIRTKPKYRDPTGYG